MFQHDNYTPMIVETDDQYQGVLDVFPYRDLDLEKAPFPKQFPFSSFVPQIYTLLKNFINSMIDYGHDLNIRYVRMCVQSAQHSDTVIVMYICSSLICVPV